MQSLAKALSEISVYNRERFSKLKDTSAQRIAAEFVAQYLSTHEMMFTIDSLEKETNNHIRQRHDEKYITHRLKLAQGDNIIERLREPPVSYDSATTNTSITRSLLSPPPKLAPPPLSPDSEHSTTTSTRKIHVRVKKGKDGKILEDPKSIVNSAKVLKRISKKDKDFLLTITKTDSNSPTKLTNESTRKHHKHHHDKEEKLTKPTAREIKELNPEDEVTIDSDDKEEPPKLQKPPTGINYHSRNQDKYPDVKPRLVNAEVGPDKSHQFDDDDLLLQDTKPALSYLDRIRMQLKNEVENKSKEIELLKKMIKEKDEKEKKEEIPIPQNQKVSAANEEVKLGKKMVGYIPSDITLLTTREEEMLSPKVSPGVIRQDSPKLPAYSFPSTPKHLPAIQTDSSDYYEESYYSDI